jgi:oxygen-dependent protoporphyrinogen oxidase
MARVIVCGAGISGLSTAYWLKSFGHDVVIFEAADRAGGVIQTLQKDGYLFEKGPNSFLDNAPEVFELCEGLKLENQILKQSMRGNKRYVYFNGELQEVPTGPGALISTKLLSSSAKWGLLFEAFRTANYNKEDESCASFIRRRIGNEVYERMFTPFVSGVYAANPEELSIQSSFEMLYDLERNYGSITRGMLAKAFRRKKEPAKPRAKNICSFINGMQTLPDALTRSLRENLRLSCPVTNIHPHENGMEVESNWMKEQCDAVVVTTPADTTSKLIQEMLPDASAHFQTIPYNRLTVMGLAYKREKIKHACDGFGFLVPRKQDVRILGSIWGSSLFANRAPGGERAVSVFIGGGLDKEAFDLSDDELLDLAKKDLHRTIGAEGEPIIKHIFRWKRAIPQYPIGHAQKIEKMNDDLNEIPSLFLTGNFVKGISVNDCIVNGKKTAVRVNEYLQSKP